MSILKYPGLIVVIFALTGCGYRLGNYAPNGITSLEIGRVDIGKGCDEPRMGVYTAEKVRTAFISEGSVTVTDSATSDALLLLEVKNYSVTSAGTARLASDDPNQVQYTTTIWQVTVPIYFQVVLRGGEENPTRWRQVEGKAIFNDLLDISTVRQVAIRQALANASKKLVREALDTDWGDPVIAE